MRSLLYAILGATPGVVFLYSVDERGLGFALLGAFLGGLLGLPGVSIARVTTLLFTMIVARGTGSSSVLDAADSGMPDRPSPADDALTRWLMPDVEERRTGLVIVGFFVGAVFGVVVTVVDVAAIRSGGSGFVLPLSGARDSLVAQAVVVSLACTIWGGSAAGMMASDAFQRPLLLAGTFAGFLSSCIASVLPFNLVGPAGLVTFLTTGALALALGMALLLGLEGVSDGSGEESES